MKRLDWIIIAAALALGTVSLLVMNNRGEGKAMTVEISVNGVLTESILLPASIPEERWAEGTSGGLLIYADSDGVSVIEADCPSQDCVHSGKITAPGQMIVCLPNRILIRLTGGTGDEDLEMEIDAFVR